VGNKDSTFPFDNSLIIDKHLPLLMHCPDSYGSNKLHGDAPAPKERDL